MLIVIIFASLSVLAASLIGVISVWRVLGTRIAENLHLLVSFAAGVFMALSFHLVQEVLAQSSSARVGLTWIVVGFVAVWLVVKIVPHGHHHHPEDDEKEPHSRLDARRLLVSDSLHNIGDGVLIATSFLTSVALGWASALSIFIHELVQELSEFFVLKEAGYSTSGALRVNGATSATVLIGSVGGYFLLEQFSALEVPVLALSSGALIALLLQDVLPHSYKNAREQRCIPQHLIAALCGALVMVVMFALVSEAHGS